MKSENINTLIIISLVTQLTTSLFSFYQMNKNKLLSLFSGDKKNETIYFSVTSCLSAILLTLAVRTGILGTSEHFKDNGVWYLLVLAILQVASSSIRVNDINKKEEGWTSEKIGNSVMIGISVLIIVFIGYEKYQLHQENKPKPNPLPDTKVNPAFEPSVPDTGPKKVPPPRPPCDSLDNPYECGERTDCILIGDKCSRKN